MAKPDSLGQFEQLVLTAILALREDAHGVTIHSKVLQPARPKAVSLGAVYVMLDRLEDKALVSSWLSDRALLREQWGLSRLAVRAGVALFGMVLEDAYAKPGEIANLRPGPQDCFRNCCGHRDRLVDGSPFCALQKVGFPSFAGPVDCSVPGVETGLSFACQ
jgi:hypothetical protein